MLQEIVKTIVFQKTVNVFSTVMAIRNVFVSALVTMPLVLMCVHVILVVITDVPAYMKVNIANLASPVTKRNIKFAII